MALEQVGLEAVFITEEFQRGLKQYLNGIDAANAAASRHGASVSDLGKESRQQWGIIAGAAAAATTAIISAVGAMTGEMVRLAGSVIETGIKVESAFAGVIKTTDNLVDATGNLTPLGEKVRQGFRDLALSVPQDLPSLMHVGELAGQLGIADDQIVEFTRTMAALGVSTNLTADQAAFAIAKIQNIFAVSADDMANNAARFGSAIVALGNNFATTEADIVAFTQRIAGAGQIAGLSEADVAGIGAALSSLGVEAEAGGTAVQKVLLGINEAAIKGGKGLDTFAKTAGLSATEFKKLWQEDAASAFQLFVEGLGKQGDNALFTLQELGLEDQRLVRSFLSLAGSGDLLSRAMQTANTAFDENTALSIEAARRYATLESKIQIFKNALSDAALTMADQLMPILTPAVDAVTAFVKAFAAGPLTDFTAAISKMFEALQNGAFAQELLPAIADAVSKITGLSSAPDFSWLTSLADTINLVSDVIARLINAGSLGEFLAVLTGGNTDAFNFLAGLATAFTVAGDVISSVVNVIVSSVLPLLQSAFANVTATLATFGLDWGDVWNAVKTAITIVAGIIGAILLALVGVIVGVVNGIAGAVNTMTAVWNEASKFILGIIEGIGKIFIGLGVLIQSIAKGDWATAAQAFKTIWDGVYQTIVSTFSLIVIAIVGAVATVLSFVSHLVDGVIKFFQSLYDELVGHSIIWDIVDGIIGAFQDLVNSGPKVFTDFVNSILGSADDLLKGITGVMGDVGAKVLEVLGNIFAGGGGGAGAGLAGGDIGASLIGPILQSLTQLELLFNTAIFNMQTQWQLFYNLLATSLLTFPTLFEPLLGSLNLAVFAMQGIIIQLSVLSAAFATLAAQAALAGTAFSTNFAATALAGLQVFIAGAVLQFQYIDAYWFETILHMVGHWRDFVVAAEDLTNEFVFKTIQQFDQLHNVSVGKIHDIRNAFKADFADIILQLDNQLGPSLQHAAGGFGSLAAAAKAAAEKTAAAMDAVCASVQKANGCITGSPELIIQHPFDKFSQFMGTFETGFNRDMASVLASAEELERLSGGIDNAVKDQMAQVNRSIPGLAQPAAGNVTNNNQYTIGPNTYTEQSPQSMVDDIILINKLAEV